MTIKQIVANVLEHSPETRNSDIELIIQVWELQGVKFTMEQRIAMRNCSSAETIRRIRQKLQEGGQYLASTPVAKQRRLFAAEHRIKHREGRWPE